MIPINELKVGNWVKYMGKHMQIDGILIDKNSVTLRNCNLPARCNDIEPIIIHEKSNTQLIIDRMLELPNGKTALDFISDNDIWHLHEVQNKCKDATNIKL